MALTSFTTYGSGDVITSADLNAVRTAINALEARVHEALTGTQDGSNKVFTTSQDIATNSERVTVNGIPSPDFYSVTGTNEITFETAPKTWWVLEIEYRIG